MAQQCWNRCLAIVAASVLASTVVSAQTSKWPGTSAVSHGSVARPSTSQNMQSPRESGTSLGRHPDEVFRLPAVSSPDLAAVLPATDPRNGTAGTSERNNDEIDGTWREDGQYLVINVNGQQLRFAKTGSPGLPVSPDAETPELPVGGEVNGRLSHEGQPLVNCEVAIVPLLKRWTGYTLGKSGERLATTDGDGRYTMRGVPTGAYKLKWRPAGEASWIRRAELRPDVRVRGTESLQVKEVRIALRTIN